jgi:hypothetical protein
VEYGRKGRVNMLKSKKKTPDMQKFKDSAW